MTWSLRRDKEGTGYYTYDQLRARDLAVAQAVIEACAKRVETQDTCGDYVESWFAFLAAAIRTLQIAGENDK